MPDIHTDPEIITTDTGVVSGTTRETVRISPDVVARILYADDTGEALAVRLTNGETPGLPAVVLSTDELRAVHALTVGLVG